MVNIKIMPKVIDFSKLIGNKYNKLTIISEATPRVGSDGYNKRFAVVKCDCGNVKDVRISSLLSGSTKSCGCIRTDESVLKNIVVGFNGLDSLTQTGVYKIYHISNVNAFYIGCTSKNKGEKKCSIGFYRRFLEHLFMLNKNRHHSYILQNVSNKFGIDGIRFEIVEVIESRERKYFFDREQYYIDNTNSEYNVSRISNCPTVPYTKERREKASNRMKNMVRAYSLYDHSRRPVFQYDKSGVFVASFDSLISASKNTSIDRASINKCALGKRKSAGGFVWLYEK